MFGRKLKSSLVSDTSQEPEREQNRDHDSGLFQKLSSVLPNQNPIHKSEDMQMFESDHTASVSKNTVFTGNIVSQDNVEIFGVVEGSVTSTALVKIHGKVQGDVACGVLVASNASITGNISCEKSSVLGDNTTVNGNITATVVSVSGQINGNIVALESVSVSSKGAIYGDIRTPEIEVSKGAIVFGSVVMEKPVAVEVLSDLATESSVMEAQESLQIASSESEVDDDTFSPWKLDKSREEKPSPLALES